MIFHIYLLQNCTYLLRFEKTENKRERGWKFLNETFFSFVALFSVKSVTTSAPPPTPVRSNAYFVLFRNGIEALWVTALTAGSLRKPSWTFTANASPRATPTSSATTCSGRTSDSLSFLSAGMPFSIWSLFYVQENIYALSGDKTRGQPLMKIAFETCLDCTAIRPSFTTYLLEKNNVFLHSKKVTKIWFWVGWSFDRFAHVRKSLSRFEKSVSPWLVQSFMQIRHTFWSSIGGSNSSL